MKALNSIKVIAISTVASLILAGCGGSGSGSSANGASTGVSNGSAVVGTTISGTAIDPEIQGANVYLDANENGKYDVGELNTTTDNLGKYSLTIPDADIGKSIIVEGGIDRVTKADFKGTLKMISRATKDAQFITPLTTLVEHYRASDRNKTISDIKNELATKLGLSSPDDLDKDTLKNKNLLKIALRIQRVAQKVSDLGGKDISSVYKRIAKRLSTADFDTAIKDAIDSDINSKSLDYSRIRDLDRELKNVDDSSLSAEGLALTVDNIDRNISNAKTKEELDIDIYNNVTIIIHDEKEAKDFIDRKVLDRLGFKDLSDAVKRKLIASKKLDFKNDLISDIKEKIAKNEIGLEAKDVREIDREEFFNKAGFVNMIKDSKRELKDKLDNENFDFAKASEADFESKLADSNFMSGLSSTLISDLAISANGGFTPDGNSPTSPSATAPDGDSSTASGSTTSDGDFSTSSDSTASDGDSSTSI